MDEREPIALQNDLRLKVGRAVINRGLVQVFEEAYPNYREQIPDENNATYQGHTWAKFALNRVGGALFNPYPEAQITPWPFQGEHYLPVNSGRYMSAAQVYKMGGVPIGEGTSITDVQSIQSVMRAWPFLKNKMRDILFGDE